MQVLRSLLASPISPSIHPPPPSCILFAFLSFLLLFIHSLLSFSSLPLPPSFPSYLLSLHTVSMRTAILVSLLPIDMFRILQLLLCSLFPNLPRWSHSRPLTAPSSANHPVHRYCPSSAPLLLTAPPSHPSLTAHRTEGLIVFSLLSFRRVTLSGRNLLCNLP